MFVQRVAQYIEKEKLLSLQDNVLVALSGGADSVAMLRVLLALGYTCEAAHCNFRLRGEESDRDERFVRQLCQTLNVPLHITTFDTTAYAQSKKISIEMAARELRYEWFNELRSQHGFSAIAVAHHQDDSVETILLNLIRGTGISGLLGIHPKQKEIIRPLLCVTRDEIIDYLKKIAQAYVTDSTNLQDDFVRNKIRLKLIPLMQEINPSVKNGLFQMGNHLKGIAQIYHQAINEGKKRVLTDNKIDIALLLDEPSPQALLFEILYPLGFTSAQIDNILTALDGQPGKIFLSKNNWRIIRDRTHLLIDPISDAEGKDTPPFQLTFEKVKYSSTFVIPKDKHIACVDADKFKEPICIRKWQQGDKFHPFGMTGKKRVSDYLTDRKFSIAQKENQWLLCSDNEIVWVIGERTDNRFRIDNTTEYVLIITLQ